MLIWPPWKSVESKHTAAKWTNQQKSLGSGQYYKERKKNWRSIQKYTQIYIWKNKINFVSRKKRNPLDCRFLSIVNRYTCFYPSFHSLKVLFVFLFNLRWKFSKRKCLFDVVLGHSPWHSNHWAFIWSRLECLSHNATATVSQNYSRSDTLHAVNVIVWV